ncbi:hypothetical protein MBLNU457_6950t1 [Dothideomycetes sp. NU457]
MDLPPISLGAQIAILTLLGLSHIIAILLFLSNFPLDIHTLRSRISHTINQLVQKIHSRKKETDEEAPSPSIVTQHQQAQIASEMVRPRWPFQSMTSVLSPRSTHASTTTPSTWHGSVIRRQFGRDATPTPFTATATPVPATREPRTDTAYTSSVSLSPYPNVTPTPVRRFMRADALYSPSVYPVLESVKRDRGVEWLSPSVYSPVSERGAGAEVEDCAVAGAGRDVAEDGDVDAVKGGWKEQSMLTPFAGPGRPRRYFDPKREFETVTPESLEKGSIVIGLGGGLSPLVGTGGVKEGLRSVSELGEKLGPDAKLDGCSSVYTGTLTARAESEKIKEDLKPERIATPVTDDEVERKFHV